MAAPYRPLGSAKQLTTGFSILYYYQKKGENGFEYVNSNYQQACY